MWVLVTELHDWICICIFDFIFIHNFDGLIILVGTQDAHNMASCAPDLTVDVVDASMSISMLLSHVFATVLAEAQILLPSHGHLNEAGRIISREAEFIQAVKDVTGDAFVLHEAVWVVVTGRIFLTEPLPTAESHHGLHQFLVSAMAPHVIADAAAPEGRHQRLSRDKFILRDINIRCAAQVEDLSSSAGSLIRGGGNLGVHL